MTRGRGIFSKTKKESADPPLLVTHELNSPKLILYLRKDTFQAGKKEN